MACVWIFMTFPCNEWVSTTVGGRRRPADWLRSVATLFVDSHHWISCLVCLKLPVCRRIATSNHAPTQLCWSAQYDVTVLAMMSGIVTLWEPAWWTSIWAVGRSKEATQDQINRWAPTMYVRSPPAILTQEISGLMVTDIQLTVHPSSPRGPRTYPSELRGGHGFVILASRHSGATLCNNIYVS